MIVWKDLLKPISSFVDVNRKIRDVIPYFSSHDKEVLFVIDQGSLVGYCTKEILLHQLAESLDMDQPITYRDDILKVPQLSPVEFYHNATLIIGIDKGNQIVGYTSIEEARHTINALKLKDINLLLHGAGVGIVKTNVDYQIEFMNETAENIVGISSSFFLGRNYKILLTSDKDIAAVMEGKTIVSANSSLNFKQISGNFYPLEEDGRITGLVHVFFSREVFEEAVQELDFVRNLNSDLQAVYASSQEQILVIDGSGKIIRVAGTFLQHLWKAESPEEILGKQVEEFTKRKVFQPNVFEICKTQKKKVTAIQDSDGGYRFWSVATPVYYEGKLEKIVVLSRDITPEAPSFKGQSDGETDTSLHNRQEFIDKDKRLIYRSKKIEKLVKEISRVAQYNSTVLLEGESGVGKEVFAQQIHTASPRSEQPFVRINCGAIPETLIESELFGYENGSFTGADKKGKAGLFEVANNGTLFLDEIGELPLNMQVKLLRVLQEKEITRIGGLRPISVNVRIITATNRDLREMVSQGKFREDLYYRLCVIPFRIPALRDRKEDILPLSIYFLEQFAEMYEIKKSFTPEAIQVLETYSWQGNVRELQNIVERLILLTEGEWIQREHVLNCLYGESEKRNRSLFVLELMPLKEAVEELEIQLIEKGMQQYPTADHLSKVLGVSPATLSRRIKKLKLERRVKPHV
ncbi:sigma 54-interacting transcriptional regulator [Neobacillus mesonae]|uniref:sigma 54-interacting transcriptional regulator n=1 Tax=Neobacillus mesonae TaxID=1193713 RepID=UPI00203C0345|nr:sigma 54-interacting transcriptional regulator [Neobacillus mesonae]MCM3568651.1 sigma 54-interacting transcriptional regulator [Neobacillus mesonae]